MLIMATNKRNSNSMVHKKSKANSLLNIMNMIFNNLMECFKNAAFQKMVSMTQSFIKEIKSGKEAINHNKIQFLF